MSKLSNILPLCLVGPWFTSSAERLGELPSAGGEREPERCAGVSNSAGVDRHVRLALGVCLSDSSFQGARARN